MLTCKFSVDTVVCGPDEVRWADLLHPTLRRILDNLPVAMVKMRKDESTGALIKTYERGFPVGFKASLEVGAEPRHASPREHGKQGSELDAYKPPCPCRARRR